jgi:hypothetical protein
MRYPMIQKQYEKALSGLTSVEQNVKLRMKEQSAHLRWGKKNRIGMPEATSFFDSSDGEKHIPVPILEP